MKHYLVKLSLLAILVTAFTAVQALPEDSQQPIRITSDSAIKDNKNGFTVYEGDVDMNQGSLNIKADKVTIYIENEEVTTIIAEGKPARFKQKPEPDQEDVLAKALTIEYRVAKKIITLTKNASLDQQGSTITGNIINYDINAARVEADSTESDRVEVVIPAKTPSSSSSSEKK
ncbi:MAG: lipopolysaccharide transport periplasmic protein LptA [Cellvibrionaceae bacterium]